MTLLLALLGCAQPVHLQYDHGRAYYTMNQVQADRTRESVKDAVYPLSGFEAANIRIRAEEATTDVESGKMEVVAE